MKSWESERKRQKQVERHDAIAGSIALFGFMMMFVASIALSRFITYTTSAVFTFGALLLEAGFFMDHIYNIKDGRKK